MPVLCGAQLHTPYIKGENCVPPTQFFPLILREKTVPVLCGAQLLYSLILRKKTVYP